MEKYKGIKKSVGQFNRWQGHAEIMVDKNRKEVFCNVYASPGEFTNYHKNENIQRVVSKSYVDMAERDNKVKMEQIKNFIKNLE